MATKKKTRKKQARTKKTTAGKKLKPTKKKLAKKKMATKKTAQKKAAVKAKAVSKRAIGGKSMAATKKQRKRQSVDAVPFTLEEPVSRSSRQSGDLQGLSNLESADTESVDELLEEGNAFEADVVMGVEDAAAAEGREVHTHEVPEDDVPGEYLDKD